MKIKELFFASALAVSQNVAGENLLDKTLRMEENARDVIVSGRVPGIESLEFKASLPKEIIDSYPNTRVYPSISQKFSLNLDDVNVYVGTGIKFPYYQYNFEGERIKFSEFGLGKTFWALSLPVYIGFNLEEREKDYRLYSISSSTSYEIFPGLVAYGNLDYVADNIGWQGIESSANLGLKITDNARIDVYFQKSWNRDSERREEESTSAGIKFTLNF